MSFFGNAKKMYDMQSKAKAAQKKLKNIHVESEDEDIKVTVTGEMKPVEIVIHNKELLKDEAKLTTKIIEHWEKATDKAQKVSAENMKDIMGDMDLGALFGK